MTGICKNIQSSTSLRIYMLLRTSSIHIIMWSDTCMAMSPSRFTIHQLWQYRSIRISTKYIFVIGSIN